MRTAAGVEARTRPWQLHWTFAVLCVAYVWYNLLGVTAGLAPWPPGTPHEPTLWAARAGQLVLVAGASYLAIQVFPFASVGGARWRKTALLLGVAALASIAAAMLDVVARAAAGLPAADWFLVARQGFILFGGFSGVGQIIRGRGRLHASELAELRLRAELSDAELRRAQAELRMLRREMNPHFMFNALQVIQALIVRDPTEARRAVVRLGDVLRGALQRSETQEVALAEEMEILGPFLEFEELRLGVPLALEWRVADEVREARVPHLLLQPLLENAVKHGLSRRSGAGRVVVRAARDGEWLVIEIADEGEGLLDEATPGAGGAGIGVANTRRRLREMYGDAHSFAVEGAPGGGAVATVRIPFRVGPPSLSSGEPGSRPPSRAQSA